MADDVTFQTTVATPPSGTKVAADDVGGVHYQRVKLDVGADGASTPVEGTVPVSGTVAVTNAGLTELAAAIDTELQVDVVGALPAGTNNIGDVDVLTVPAPLSTAGNGTAATAHRVTLASDSTGTVAATQSGTWNVTNVSGTVSLPTGASTLAEQQSQTTHLATIAGDTTDIETAVELIDDTVATLGTSTYTEATTKGLVVGAVRRDADTTLVDTTNEVSPLQVDANGRLKVEAFDSGDSHTVDAADGTFFVRSNASSTFPVQIPATAANPTKAEDAVSNAGDAGTAALAVRKATPANTSDTDGDYEFLQMSAGRLWTSSTVEQATAASLNAQVVGNIAHDTAHSGNPVTTAGTHETIADSAPTNRLASVTDGDVQRFSTTDGALFVIPTGPQSWKARLTGSMSDTTVKAAPSSGLSLYITDIIYSIGAATASTILLEESTTTAVFGPHYLEAVNGRGLAVHLGTPIKITAATLLSATNSGSTTATLDVYGFTAPG